MIAQCIAACAVLGVVIIGLLVMVQAITVEQALHAIGRIFAFIVLSSAAICLLRGLFQTLAIHWLPSIATLLAWLVIVALAFVVFAVVTKIVATRVMYVQRRFSKRDKP